MSSAKLLNYKHINRDKYRYMPPVDSGEGYHQSECLYDYDQTGKNISPDNTMRQNFKCRYVSQQGKE